MSSPNVFSFRALAEDDLPQLQRWLNEAHVHEWYGRDEDNSAEEVRKRYKPLITGEDSTDAYIVSLSGKPIAYVQAYRIDDNPDYARYVGMDEHAAGVDLFIGEARCVIGPEPANRRAIRVYEKVGFRFFKTVQIPGEPDPEYLMELHSRGAVRD